MYKSGGHSGVIYNSEQLQRKFLRSPTYSHSDYFPTIRKVTAKPAEYLNDIYESKRPAFFGDTENIYDKDQGTDIISFHTPIPVEPPSQPMMADSPITEYEPSVERIFINRALEEIFPDRQEPFSAVDNWTDDTELAVLDDALDNAFAGESGLHPEADQGQFTVDDNSIETAIDDVLQDNPLAQEPSLDNVMDEVMGKPDHMPDDPTPDFMEFAPY